MKLTNAMMVKGLFRNIDPAGEQRVRVHLPGGRRPGRIQLLVSGIVPPVVQSEGYATAVVPSISVHEVVGIVL